MRHFLLSALTLFLMACGDDCPTIPPVDKWETETFDVFPYRARLTWRPERGANQSAVLFVCGLGYKCAGKETYFSEDLQRGVQKLGFATLLVDPSGTGAAHHGDGDSIGLEQRAKEIFRMRWEILGRFSPVVVVGHSIGAATALRAAAEYGTFQGVAGLGFAPFSAAPNVPPATIASLLAQGSYVQFPADLRKAFFFYNPSTDGAGYVKDAALSDPFPRRLLLDALGLFQSPAPLMLAKITAPVYLQQYEQDAVYQPTGSWAYAKTDTFADIGHSAELHKNPGPTRAALLTWLGQFARP